MIALVYAKFPLLFYRIMNEIRQNSVCFARMMTFVSFGTNERCGPTQWGELVRQEH